MSAKMEIGREWREALQAACMGGPRRGESKSIGDYINKAPGTWRNELNPDYENAQPALWDMAVYMKHTGNLEPLKLLCRMFRGYFIAEINGDNRPELLAVDTLTLCDYVGNVAGAMGKALDPNGAEGRAITLEESREILKPLELSIAQAHTVRVSTLASVQQTRKRA